MEKLPAVFLDRDGVLNEERSYIVKLEQLRIFPYARECIKRIHDCGFRAIVISNQSAVGRGFMTEKELYYINQYLMDELKLDAVYYCPHWHGEEKSLPVTACNCRKPNIGLIEKAQMDFGILLEESYFVGDRDTDVQTGKNCGIKTVLLKSGYAWWNETARLEPDYMFKDLVGFTDKLEELQDKKEQRREKL